MSVKMFGCRNADIMETSLTKSSSALRPALSLRTLIATSFSPLLSLRAPTIHFIEIILSHINV